MGSKRANEKKGFVKLESDSIEVTPIVMSSEQSDKPSSEKEKLKDLENSIKNTLYIFIDKIRDKDKDEKKEETKAIEEIRKKVADYLKTSPKSKETDINSSKYITELSKLYLNIIESVKFNDEIKFGEKVIYKMRDSFECFDFIDTIEKAFRLDMDRIRSNCYRASDYTEKKDEIEIILKKIKLIDKLEGKISKKALIMTDKVDRDEDLFEKAQLKESSKKVKTNIERYEQRRNSSKSLSIDD